MPVPRDLVEIIIDLTRSDALYAEALLAIIKKLGIDPTTEWRIRDIEHRRRWDENARWLSPPDGATPSLKGQLGVLAGILSQAGIRAVETPKMPDRELRELRRMGKGMLALLRERLPKVAP